MEFTQKKLNIIMAAAIVIGASTLGGLFYSSHKADAREAAAKQIVMDNIDKMQDLQETAKQAKAGAPVVSQDYPALITPEPVAVPIAPIADAKPITPPATETKQIDQKPATKEAPVAIPQQSPPPPKVAPTLVTPPPAQQEPVQAITALSDADIQRLQSYTQYATTDGVNVSEVYVSFQNMYTNERANCDGLLQKFSPITLSDYYKAKAEWLTSPRLVYQSAIGDYCVRGVLTLTYYEVGNKFGLTPNVKYQSEVEYRLDNSVKNGKITLSLHSTNYLSEFKAVE